MNEILLIFRALPHSNSEDPPSTDRSYCCETHSTEAKSAVRRTVVGAEEDRALVGAMRVNFIMGALPPL